MDHQDYITAYCRRIATNFGALEKLAPEIASATVTIDQALRIGNKVLLCGNGGSAADAQHIAAELMGRFNVDREALPAIALTTDSSLLTAVANDYDFSDIFKRQIEGLGVAGDVLIAISTSGNSDNIIKAAKAAKAKSMRVIGLTGQLGGQLSALCDHSLRVPSNETSHIQEMHIAVGHMICGMVESALA